MASVAETELAWAAGFFDGEGSTSLTKTRYLSVSVNQKHLDPIERFHRALGGLGRVYTVNTSARGIVYQWRASDRDGRPAIERLWPYLGEIKRAQAKRCVAGSKWIGGKRCQVADHEWTTQGSQKVCATCKRRRSKRYRGSQVAAR
jgi:hypothetical protein